MKIKLAVVSSSGSNWTEVEEEGTLIDSLEVGDELSFSNKNLESDKRVTLFIYEKGEEAPKMIACSTHLSTTVRSAIAQGVKKSQIIRNLLDLRVVKNDKGYFIVPTGNQAERFTLSVLKKQQPVSWEELVA